MREGEDRVYVFPRTQFAPGDYAIGDRITARAPDGVELEARIVAIDQDEITLAFDEPSADKMRS